MHESRHTKDKKLVVFPHCEKSYSQWDKLRKHIDHIHPDKPHKQHHTETHIKFITHQPKAGLPLLHVNHIKPLPFTDQRPVPLTKLSNIRCQMSSKSEVAEIITEIEGKGDNEVEVVSSVELAVEVDRAYKSENKEPNTEVNILLGE